MLNLWPSPESHSVSYEEWRDFKVPPPLQYILKIEGDSLTKHKNITTTTLGQTKSPPSLASCSWQGLRTGRKKTSKEPGKHTRISSQSSSASWGVLSQKFSDWKLSYSVQNWPASALLLFTSSLRSYCPAMLLAFCSVLYTHMTWQKTDYLTRGDIRYEKATRITARPGRRTMSPDSQSCPAPSFSPWFCRSWSANTFPSFSQVSLLLDPFKTNTINIYEHIQWALRIPVQFHWNLSKTTTTLLESPLLLAECRDRQSPALLQEIDFSTSTFQYFLRMEREEENSTSVTKQERLGGELRHSCMNTKAPSAAAEI